MSRLRHLRQIARGQEASREWMSDVKGQRSEVGEQDVVSSFVLAAGNDQCSGVRRIDREEAGDVRARASFLQILAWVSRGDAHDSREQHSAFLPGIIEVLLSVCGDLLSTRRWVNEADIHRKMHFLAILANRLIARPRRKHGTGG